MNSLLIEHPEKQSSSQRWGYRFLTLSLWALFAYFFRPVLTLAVWLLGYRRFQEVMIGAHGWEDLVRLLLAYSLVIFGMGQLIVGWSLYNLLRYGHHEKRRNPPRPVTVEMLAEYYGIDAGRVQQLQKARRVTLDFDGEGRIVSGHGSFSVTPPHSSPDDRSPREAFLNE